jgi:hypothetical protein
MRLIAVISETWREWSGGGDLEGDAAGCGISLIWWELGWFSGVSERVAKSNKPVAKLTYGKTLE